MLFFKYDDDCISLMEENGIGERTVIATSDDVLDPRPSTWVVISNAKLPNKAAEALFAHFIHQAYISMNGLALNLSIMRAPSMLTNRD